MLTVKFIDGELVQNVGWLSLPQTPIQRIKYVFNGKIIILEGYESYNHLLERVYAVIGQTVSIRATYLMGMKDGKVKVVILNYITGTIQEKETLFGQEYNGRPSTGWKKGVSATYPLSQIF